jgi:hypothetical protein
MAAHRKLWARIAFNQLSKAAKFDKAHVRQIMRATSDSEAALKHIKTYFEGPSRVYWASVLRTVWKTTGKEASQVVNDLITGKDFMRSLTGVTLYGPQRKDGALEAASAGSSWDQIVEQKITARANKVKGVTDTTYEQIKRVMLAGHDEGATHYEIGQRIEEHLDELWPGRGEAISRTEVNGAMNTAMLSEAQQISPELNKVWSCTMSINSRQSHMDADGQSVPQGEPFNIDGEDMEEPGDDSASPENVINCECTMFFEQPEEGSNE